MNKIEDLKAAHEAARKKLEEALPAKGADGQIDYSGVDDAKVASIKALTDEFNAAKSAYEAEATKMSALDAARGAVASQTVQWTGQAKAVAVDSAGNVKGDDSEMPGAARETAYKAAFDRFVRSHGRDSDPDDLAMFRDVRAKAGKGSPDGVVIPPELAIKAMFGRVKAMREGVDVEGGFAVPGETYAGVTGKVAAPTRLLDLVNRVGASGDKLSVPGVANTGDVYSSDVRIAWTGEEGPAVEDTGLENFSLREIDIHEGMFEVASTKSMREDAVFDVAGFIAQKVQDAYNTGIQQEIVNGTGVGRPLGFLQAGSGITTFNVGNPATADGLIQFVGDLPEQYAEGAYVVANRSWAFQTVAIMKDTGGAYVGLLGSRDTGLAGARTDALVGHPLVYAAQMPTAGAANRVALIADLRQLYWLVERTVMTIEPIGVGSDAYRRAGADGWYVRFRVGGMIVNPWAGRIAVQS